MICLFYNKYDYSHLFDMFYTAQEVWEHRLKNQTGELGDSSQMPYKLTFKYPVYQLMKISLKLIKCGNQDFNKELDPSDDEIYAKEYASYQTEAPAIVVHFDGDYYHIIDGRHRVRSYFIRKLNEINAYVGGL